MSIEATEYLQGDDTAEFLNRISRRLSSREDCKNAEFQVTILNHKLSMYPYIEVFPDTHHRAKSDKRSIIDFIISTFEGCTLNLANGVYQYQFVDSYKRKHRRWVKL